MEKQTKIDLNSLPIINGDNSKEIKELSNLSREDQENYFKNTLKKLGITSTWKWEDASRILYRESIWKVIKTFSEKRNLFNEYINDLKNKERQEKELKREKLKAKFRQLLQEDNTINSDFTYAEGVAKYSHDDRWRAVDENDREDLFEDYIDLIYKKEEDEWKKSREIKKKLFLEKLKISGVTSGTLWKNIQYNFKDDPVFVSMEKIDQIQTFADYIVKLEKSEKKEKNTQLNYKNFLNREKFRELLQINIENKKLNMETKWKDFILEIKDKEEYWNMLGQEGSTPLELFQDTIQQLKKEYKMNKNILKNIIIKNNLKFNFGINFEDFCGTINKYDTKNEITNDMKEILFQHLTKKLKEKETIHNKHSRDIANKLYSYLQRKKLLLPENCEIEEALPKIKALKKFEHLNESSIKEGYSLLQKLIKEKPLETNENSIKKESIDIDEEKEMNKK